MLGITWEEPYVHVYTQPCNTLVSMIGENLDEHHADERDIHVINHAVNNNK